AGAAQRVLDLLAEAGQVVLGDRAALAGLADAGDRLLPVEALGGPGPLHDGQLHQLEGGEPLLARLAAATTADRAAVRGDAGVEDLGVVVPAERAVHRGPPLSGRNSDTPSRGVDSACGWARVLLCRTSSYLLMLPAVL